MGLKCAWGVVVRGGALVMGARLPGEKKLGSSVLQYRDKESAGCAKAMAASKPIDAKEMETGRERDDIKKTYSTLLAAATGGGGKPRLDQTRSGEYVNLT